MHRYSAQLLSPLFLILLSVALPWRAAADELRVSSGSDYETRVLSLAPEERGEVTVFVNSRGHSPENFVISLARSGETVEVIERRRTGANGTVRFRNVPAGDYRVTLRQELGEADSYEATIGDVVLSKPSQLGKRVVKKPLPHQTEASSKKHADKGPEKHSSEKHSEEKQ